MTPVLATLLDALETEAPEAVSRGRVALARALGWLEQTRWREVAWAFSGLASGTPLEIVWRPGCPGLYWTAEPAAPEWPRLRRLRRGLAILRANGTGLGRAGEQLVRRAHTVTCVEWPVLIAGRHDASGDSGKLYLHARGLQPGFTDLARHLLPQDRPMMTGLSNTGQRELYWERLCQAEDPWRMRQDPQLRELAERLDATLCDWTGAGLGAQRTLGLSLSVGPDGVPMVLAAFQHLPRNGDGNRLRRRLLSAGGEANPALACAWAADQVLPMLLTLAVSTVGARQALGFRLRAP